MTAVILPAVADPDAGGAMKNPRYIYTYDRFGQQTRQIDAKAAKLLPADLSTISEAQYDAVPHTRFEYDPLTGQRTARVLPLGQREEFRYDTLGEKKRGRDSICMRAADD